MNKDIAEATVKVLHDFLTEGEVRVHEPYEVKDAKMDGFSKPGIYITDDGTEIAVGAALAVALALRAIDRRIQHANSPKTAEILEVVRKGLLDEVIPDLWVAMPSGRLTSSKEKGVILY